MGADPRYSPQGPNLDPDFSGRFLSHVPVPAAELQRTRTTPQPPSLEEMAPTVAAFG